MYGNHNTCELVGVYVTHNIAHGTRYEVDEQTGCYLEYELEAAENLISNFVLKKKNYTWRKSIWRECSVLPT
eukprot:SAG31_NODE_114_length_24318_cov_16.787481_5_plen_72_part_00